MSNVVDVVARVQRATVYEDRADVVRVAEVELPGGASVLRLLGLPAVLSESHVVASLTALDGAREMNVNDVRVTRVMTGETDPQDERRRARQQQLEGLQRDVQRAENAYKASTTRLANTSITLKRFLEELGAAVGRGQGGDRSAWAASLQALQAEVRAAEKERSDGRREVLRLRAAVADAGDDARPKPLPQKLVADLQLRVSGVAGRYRLELRTVVPCAAWRPSHEATLVRRAEGDRVRFATHASVWQATGEDWTDVELVLSTARPSAGAELPPLRPDRLTLRLKSAEERKTIVVEHREEALPQSATQGSAPGVDDGGVARVFKAPRMTVRSDGRPHRAHLDQFEAPCTTARVAMPELAPQVFLRASLKNAGSGPILAGPVTLTVSDVGGGSSYVGTGDLLFCGVGETLDLSFGSDDRFLVRSKKRRVEDKKLVGKDVVHFVREAVLSQTGPGTEKVTVQMRLPISEVKQLKVIPSPHHCTDGEPQPDEHGIVKIAVELVPNVERKVAVAFSFDTSGDVRIPDPW